MRRTEPKPSDQLNETDEMASLVHQEIMRLPERLRSAVILCDLEGQSYRQAAVQLELPLGTVQSRLARARQRLRDRFIQKGISPMEPDRRVGPASAFIANAARLAPSASLHQACSRLCAVIATEKFGSHRSVTRSVQKLNRPY